MIAVVGAGIAGLTVARELSRDGRDVLLIDRDEIPSRHASAVPIAMLNVHRGRTARAHPEDVRGLLAMQALLRELGVPVASAPMKGVLRVPEDELQAHRWSKQEGARVLAPTHGDDLVPHGVHAPHGLVHFARGGFLVTSVFLEALERDLGRHVQRLAHTVVHAIEHANTRSLRLVTQRGTFTPSAVVCCTGAHENDFDPHMPSRRVAGEQIALPNELATPHPLPVLGKCYAAFTPGLTWVGGNHRRDEESTPLDGTRELLTEAGHLLPTPRERGRASKTFTGVRRALPDNRPLLAIEDPRLVHVFGMAGRGYLMAAEFARRVQHHLSQHLA